MRGEASPGRPRNSCSSRAGAAGHAGNRTLNCPVKLPGCEDYLETAARPERGPPVLCEGVGGFVERPVGRQRRKSGRKDVKIRSDLSGSVFTLCFCFRSVKSAAVEIRRLCRRRSSLQQLKIDVSRDVDAIVVLVG